MLSIKSMSIRGFTLIELMIVVAIIGILSSFAIPAYDGYIKKSELTSAQATLRALIAPAEAWYLENGSFTDSNILEHLGSSSDANPLGTIEITTEGKLTFTFTQDSRFPDGSTIAYMRTKKGWQCMVSDSQLEIKGCAVSTASSS